MSQNFEFDVQDIEETEEQRAAREKRLRTAEISRRFAAIDRERIRPLAAIVAGVGTDKDKSRLEALEDEAERLRNELAIMGVNHGNNV